MLTPPWYDRCWPSWITQHHGQALQVSASRNAGEWGKGNGSVDFGIDDQPRFIEAQIVEANPERFSNSTARAITTNHVTCAHRLVRIETQRDSIVILREVFQFCTETQLHVMKAAHARAQRSLELGLIKEVVVRERERT